MAYWAGGRPGCDKHMGEAMRLNGDSVLTALAGIIMLAATAAMPSSTAAGAAEIEEWTVPWANTRPRDPFTVDGRVVWFAGQAGDYIGRLDAATGDFSRLELGPGSGPHNLIVGADGSVWIAGNRQGFIGRYREGGTVRRIAMPEAAARDPHTLVFDGAGHIWFTLQGSNMLGWLRMTDEKVALVKVPVPRARPYGIVIDDAHRPWVALFGSNRIATVDPETMKYRDFELPRADSRPRRLVWRGDGFLWYGDYRGGRLGRLDPRDGSVTEWALPAGATARPYAMAADNRGRIWLVETGLHPNRFVAFDVAAEKFTTKLEVPSGGGTVRNMMFHAPTRSIWFGTDSNTIGRLSVE